MVVLKHIIETFMHPQKIHTGYGLYSAAKYVCNENGKWKNCQHMTQFIRSYLIYYLVSEQMCTTLCNGAVNYYFTLEHQLWNLI